MCLLTRKTKKSFSMATIANINSQGENFFGIIEQRLSWRANIKWIIIKKLSIYLKTVPYENLLMVLLFTNNTKCFVYFNSLIQRSHFTPSAIFVQSTTYNFLQGGVFRNFYGYWNFTDLLCYKLVATENKCKQMNVVMSIQFVFWQC